MKAFLFSILLAALNIYPVFAQNNTSPHSVFAEALMGAKANSLDDFYQTIGEYQYTFRGRDDVLVHGKTRMDKLLAFEWMDDLSRRMGHGKSLSLGRLKNTDSDQGHFSYWIMEGERQSDIIVEFVCTESLLNEPTGCKIIGFVKGISPREF